MSKRFNTITELQECIDYLYENMNPKGLSKEQIKDDIARYKSRCVEYFGWEPIYMVVDEENIRRLLKNKV